MTASAIERLAPYLDGRLIPFRSERVSVPYLHATELRRQKKKRASISFNFSKSACLLFISHFSELTFHPGVLLSANAEVEGSHRSGSYY